MMIMEYFPNGSIKNNYNELNLHDKLKLFSQIVRGLKAIHSKGFIHKDLHSGNVLNWDNSDCNITDLGLCRPVNKQDDEKKIFGVLPYIAPEVLKGKKYTQAADIYSLGIVECEVLSDLPPYHNLPHDEFLALKICQGLRPKINVKIPSLLENLID